MHRVLFELHKMGNGGPDVEDLQDIKVQDFSEQESSGDEQDALLEKIAATNKY